VPHCSLTIELVSVPPNPARPFVIRRLSIEEEEPVTAVLSVARLHQGNGYYLVAWQGEDPIGHVHLALTEPPELQDVLVREAHRRQGVATALTEAAEQEVRRLGFDRLRLTVSVDNAPAQAVYRQCGYLDTGLPPHRVKGTVQIRTGPLEVDDTLLTWEKRL
jgi:GNAT superfamily N-acetyltransferase